MFPLTFLADTFAPTDNMPTALRVVAEWNPISALVRALRELWGNPGPDKVDPSLPLRHPEIATLIWVVVITAVCAPLALRAFRRRTQD
jgi:ABC-type multidrug transport system permease subunit